MENIMKLLNNRETPPTRVRQNLFSNQLALKNGLREAYDTAININKSIEEKKLKKKLNYVFLRKN